jgi:DNA repair exonuclease SbcCD ATPase subunit
MSSDLDDRIAVAFADGVKSSDVSLLIAEAEAAAAAADEAAERARERALDPALTANAVAEARRQMEDAVFRRERMQAAVTRLKERLLEVKALEENERRRIAYDKVKAERDLLAQELKAIYPRIESQLGQLIPRIEANDREIDYINGQALPMDAERLQSAELIARDLESWRVIQTDVVRFTRELCLPAFKHDPHRPYAWPRSRL